MLQAIRDKAQGWIAWVIVILISIPFALWGIQEYLGLGQEPLAAKVAGAEITQYQVEQRVFAERERLREQLGEAYDPDMFPEAILAERMRDQLIGEYVLRHAADKWGLRVGDEMLAAYVRSQTVFQNEGRFDPQLYEMVLRNNGYSPKQYQQMARQDMVLTQLRRALLNSSFTTRHELSETARLQQQRREVRYVRFDADDFIEGVEVNEQALQDFYAQNPAAYTLPERVKLAYLVLDLETIAERVAVDDNALRGYFETHEGQFRVPEERRVRHILVTADEATRDEALAKADSLRTRLLAGDDFAELAREFSDDPGSAAEGGDLGWVQRGMMVEPFEEATFALESGVLSEPVLSSYGYHLIEVTDIRDSGEGTFEQFRTQVEQAYRRQEAENRYFDYSERMADIAYENPDSLQPAAEQLGLEIRTSDWFSRSNPPQELASPKVIAAAFSEDVLVQRLNSERIEVRPEYSVVVRVVEHETSRLQDLDEVRDQVAEAYRITQAAREARAAGEDALAELKQAASLSELAEQRGWRIETPGMLSRNSPGVSRSLLDRAFRLERPSADRATHGGVGLEDGDYAVIAVHEVEDGSVEALQEEQRERIDDQFRSQVAVGEFSAVLGELRSASDVELISDE